MGGRVFMFHKPRGCVVTRSDERGRRTVFDLLPPWVRDDGWQPVGRLDLDSRGLLLFTREGDIARELTRPGSHDKTYELWVRGRVGPAHLRACLAGVRTPVGLLRCKAIETRGGTGAKSRLLVTLDEGRNRHLRRMFGALKDEARGTPLKVLELKRVAIGTLKLDVDSGQWRWLTEAELAALLGPAA